MKTTYTVIHDPNRLLEYSSQVHCIESGDINTVLCGRNLGIQWEQCNEIDEMTIREAKTQTSCKSCLKVINNIINNY